ncbi:chloride channel protein [Beijerinckia indica]|uniref:Chloride channel core n=1 Tax=Beijerinckia indica subsp. indica (strain ATCC 9039 / DSM 1715 / NCIMB 8712) TaxID=395963 RepID=B2II18_BEII9|nr:chloride channel protein [Beijerinckia indica]ACB94601.1 Chloride channel core [Beijerinckia indica subsp. indica ATCC 9039]
MASLSSQLRRLLGLSYPALQTLLRRTFFLIGGLTVGGVAVLMAFCADQAQTAFTALLGRWPNAAFLITPIGFGLACLLAQKVFPGSQGSGIPQVIAARRVIDPKSRLSLVSVRIAIGKILVMILGLLCGASIGREGPTVQVGASIMGAFGYKAPPFIQPGLLLAGGAAGIAAAFNTPLAGIVFAIEELSRSFEARTSGLVLGCVIAAGLTSLAVVGDYTYFGSTDAILPLGPAWIIVPLCGVIGGLAGGLFSRILILFSTGLRSTFVKRRPIIFAMICGLGVAACGFLSQNSIYGTGYEQAHAIVHGDDTLPATFSLFKFLASTFSSIAGIPGGVFAPSLSVGAGLGASIHHLFPVVPLGALALLGMVGYLAGVVQTPITSFVIVLEMTEDHAMIIPVMVTALIANAASRVICGDGLYHALSRSFLEKLPKGHVLPEQTEGL